LESEQTVKGLGSSNLPLSVEIGAAKAPDAPRPGTRRGGSESDFALDSRCSCMFPARNYA
jgi:hypothetical protein